MSGAAYDRVKIARGGGRPTGRDYIKNIFRGFIELPGDRRCGDDPARVGGQSRHCYCHRKGTYGGGTGRPQFRRSQSGGLSQGAAADETGGKVRKACRLLCRHLRSQLHNRCGGEGTGTGHCGESDGNVDLMRPDYLDSDRGRRQRRRFGPRRGRPGLDAAKCRLFRDIA